jgi:alcohol dehydrogenase YqhD (iron-dependent ADH family)
MQDFVYYSPTRVLFGRSAIDALPDMLRQHGASKVMLVHYGETTPPIPLQQTKSAMKSAGIPFVEFAEVQPNPRLARVLEGIEFCREQAADFMLAIGGGSTIDTAKGIAAGVKLRPDEDIWRDYYFPKKRFMDSLPVGVVLTIASTGAETSFGTCVTHGELRSKRYTGGECLIPKFAIMNPEYSMTLSPYQTASGAFDIFTHLAERYFTSFPDVDLSDRLIEASIRALLIHIPIAVRDPGNYAARAELMWAASIAHNKILDAGRSLGDWASHDIAHELSGFYDMAHGASLAIVMPAWMKYVFRKNPVKFEQFARRVFDVDIDYNRQEETIFEMIDRLERFIRSISLPARLSDAGIDGAQIEEMTRSAMAGRKCVGTENGMMLVQEKEIRDIFKLAL